MEILVVLYSEFIALFGSVRTLSTYVYECQSIHVLCGFVCYHRVVIHPLKYWKCQPIISVLWNKGIYESSLYPRKKQPQIPLKIEMNKMYRLHSMDDGKRSEA